MSSSRHTRSSRGGGRRQASAGKRNRYTHIIRQPLQILAFLLPLIVAYELALSFVLQEPQKIRTVLAHRFLLRFFDAFSIAPQVALHMGGIAIIVVLLLWHVLNRDHWRIDWRALAYMTAESFALTLPLLTLGQMVSKAALAGMPLTADDLASLSVWSKMAISVGAGLYEELIFRMVLIAAVHTLLVDFGKASSNLAAGIAITVSAVAFAIYHPLHDETGALSLQRLVFYTLAGVYFGVVYVTRGFGIVVGVHAFYDIITVAMLTSAAD